jgi:polysaccharide deacetylase 2 family uncharacterized protein YibQ
MRFIITGILLYCLSPGLAFAQISQPSIAIIIDDIGYRHQDDLRAIELPGEIAYAIMPYSPNAQSMARLVIEQGKLVLVHLSMQPMELENQRFFGPGALTLAMEKNEFMRTIKKSLESLPEAVGANNHMGSLLTQSQTHMNWLMESLGNNSLFYLDSVTIDTSVADKVAQDKHIPYLQRDVFLDNKKDINYIQSQFDKLIKIAKINGHAIAIGHPHPETIAVLRNNLGTIERTGVSLVSLEKILGKGSKDDNKTTLNDVKDDSGQSFWLTAINNKINPKAPDTHVNIGAPNKLVGEFSFIP